MGDPDNMTPEASNSDGVNAGYQALLDAAGDAIAVIDERGTIQSFNRAAERIFGYAADEIIGQNVRMLMPEPYRGEHDGYLDAYRRTGLKRIIGLGREVSGRRRNGTVFPLALAVAEWRSGERRYFTGIMRDISEREDTQAALRESEERFRHLIEGVRDYAICMLDNQGRIVSWNSGAERITGWSGEEVIGSPLEVLLTPPEASTAHAARLLEIVRRVGRVEEESRQRRRDGRDIFVRITLTTLDSREGRARGFAFVMRDVSERIAAEDRQRTLMREVDHRARNALAVAQSLVRLSWAPDMPSYVHVVEGRIDALARVHTRIATHGWVAAPFGPILEDGLAILDPDQRVRTTVDGPTLSLTPTAAQSIALAIHELAVNAQRHGALLHVDGAVHIAWQREGPDGELVITWSERTNASSRPEPSKGFGQTIVRAMIETQLDGRVEFNWLRTGMVCRLSVSERYLTAP